MKKNMEIKEYNINNAEEFYKLREKCKYIPEFYSLYINTLREKKKIFLLVDNGIVIKYKIIAYAIVYEDLKLMTMTNNISTEYIETNSIFLSDIMVRNSKRRKGYGRKLAEYIINQKYGDKNIILQPDGDGYWFWEKFGFINDNISNVNTCILKKN